MNHSPVLQHSAQQYRRILIIKPGAVGDLLQMTPVIRALHSAFPGAGITLLVGQGSTASLFRHHPAISRVVVFDRQGKHRSLPALWRFLGDLRRSGFDLVLNFQRSNLRTWLFTLASLPARVLVYHKSRSRTIHAVANYLETLAPLGISITDLSLDFHPGEEADRFSREFFSRNGLDRKRVVALNPGATHSVNRWPAKRFAELADLLHDRLSIPALVVGGPDDAPLAREIVERSRVKPLSLAGSTSLLELGAILRRCNAVVSGDTGPMHLAAAVNTPVVALFGAADPLRTGPVGGPHRIIQALGVDCVPCRSRTCGRAAPLECMDRITADQVLKVIGELLPPLP